MVKQIYILDLVLEIACLNHLNPTPRANTYVFFSIRYNTHDMLPDLLLQPICLVYFQFLHPAMNLISSPELVFPWFRLFVMGKSTYSKTH